ncbi:MAG: N(4)-(beta-N-acetylglucosaminyl)-L-asparaginase [Fidelibacterota bacterium]|nr:MAG: N(4)-(beta-N-acetylglucosaminyl)-L-asparaginase [Candidatus Neomarinimicrobiota bacterium]
MSLNPITRRRFLTAASGLLAGLPFASHLRVYSPANRLARGKYSITAIASRNGLEAIQLAYKLISDGKDPLDAVIAGVTLVEDDPEDDSVGYGGLPNEDGVVELDAAVMHGPSHKAGAVAALRNIRNPSKVARLVMETTDHVLLVGKGALRFARAHGFKEQDLLTDKARKAWLKWKQSLSPRDDWLTPPEEDQQTGAASLLDRHTGTIHCASINSSGDISCATTTSGLSYKIPGRVGDSPIIGAGLYVDNDVGSCGSTGRGEANLQNLCSFHAVELMRGGMSPKDAGLEVLRRVASHTREERLLDDRGRPDFGLKFYLLGKDGSYAGVSMWAPARFAVADRKGARLEDCACLYDRDN